MVCVSFLCFFTSLLSVPFLLFICFLFFLFPFLSCFVSIALFFFFFFFFKQKTAYEMRISDWSSDVCSSDLTGEYSLHFQIEDFLIVMDAKRNLSPFKIDQFAYGRAVGKPWRSCVRFDCLQHAHVHAPTPQRSSWTSSPRFMRSKIASTLGADQ